MTARIGAVAERFLPDGATSLDSNQALLQAGYESQSAPSIYAMLRLVVALAVPGALFAWGPHDTSTMLLLSGMIGIALGIIGPPAMLTRLGRLRQEQDSPIDSRFARLAARLRRSRRQSRRGDSPRRPRNACASSRALV